MPGNIIILGGGLAALSSGYQFCRRGYQVTILERENQPGGMAASFEMGDKSTAGELGSDYFACDYGPHRFHSHDPEIVEHVCDLLKSDIEWSERQSRILLYGKYFNYPLDLANVLRQFPKPLIFRIVWDYLVQTIRKSWRGEAHLEQNLKDWVETRFGRKLAEIFFIEYTEKTWGIPATQISSSWAEQRITVVSLKDLILKTIFRPKTEPRSLVSRFLYPRHGGIGAIANAYSRAIREMGGVIHLSARVERIHATANRIKSVVATTGGKSVVFEADHFISSIPVMTTVQMIRPRLDDETRTAARNLRTISIIFIYLKINRPSVSNDHWIYVPQKTFTIHRISEFKNFSRKSAPLDKTMICAEITCQPASTIWKSNDVKLTEIATSDLIEVGLISRDDVLDTWVRRVPFAYPLYDLDYEGNLSMVTKSLHKLENFHSLGRQGLFRYNNMDQSIKMGLQIVNDLEKLNSRSVEKIATEQEYFG